MRKNEMFDQLLNTALPRLEKLWQRANKVPEEQEALIWESIDQLSNAFEELYISMEEVHQRTEELEAANLLLAAERRRYQELFEFAPGGYLVTDLDGVIQEANQAAANLLNIPRTSYLVDKPFYVFVTEDTRREFHSRVNNLQAAKEVRAWEVRLQPRQSKPFSAACTVSVVRNSQREAVGLRWLLQDITALRVGCKG